MFSFQKLRVYELALSFNDQVNILIRDCNFDRFINDQLKRASLSIALNIAEGSSRFSIKEKKYFLSVSRGSVFECVAALDILLRRQEITSKQYDILFDLAEQLSKILFRLRENIK